MPSLVLFGCPTLVAGDDLRIFAAITWLTRLAQIGMAIALLVISSSFYRETTPEGNCMTPKEESSLAAFNYTYLVLAVVVASIGAISAHGVWVISSRGTPTQPEQRALLRPICRFNLTIMMALRAGMIGTGYYAIHNIDEYCGCSDSPVDCSRDAYGLYWALVKSHVVELGFNLFVIVVVSSRFMPSLPLSLDSESKWRIFCRCCCTVSSFLTCCIMGGREAITGDFTDVAILMADFFDFHGTLDLAPSDIVAGLVMTKRMQQQRVDESRRTVLDRAEHLQGRIHDVESVCSEDDLDCVAKEWNAHHENASIVYRLKRHTGAQFSWHASVTKLLMADNSEDRIAIAVGVRLMRLSLAIYTWLVYAKNHPGTGLCEVYSLSARLLFQNKKRYPGDGPCCPMHIAAFLLESGIEETEIVHAQFHCGVTREPYAITLDHDLKSIIIVIRGTGSLDDLLTDLTLRPVSLEELGEKHGFDGTNRYAHAGMLQSSLWILDDIEKEGVLANLLSQESKFSKYRLRIVGHSLGAGCAAILSILLRPKYPDLVGHCFSPPGCTLSLNAAEESEEFVTSYVLDSDIIIRTCMESLENMRHDVVEMVSRIKVPKNRVIGCFNKQRIDARTLAEMNELILHSEENAPDSDFKRSWQKYEQLYENRKQTRDFPDVSLYPPGRIIQFFKTSEDEPKSCLLSFGSSEDDYVARWAVRDDFRDIRISSTFLDDHDAKKVLETLEAEASRLGLESPFIVDEPSHSSEPTGGNTIEAPEQAI